MRNRINTIVFVAIIAAAALGYHLASDTRPAAAEPYNLAVGQHRAGQAGEAILNYERAAALDPGAADIRANLSRARRDAGALQEPGAAFDRFASSLTTNEWSTIGGTALLALALLAAGRTSGLLAWPKPATRLVAAAALVALALPIAALAARHHALANRAIITTNETSLRVSPFDQAKSLTTLPCGKAVRLVPGKAHGDYRLAELESGQRGWIKAAEFGQPIITRK